MIKIFKFGNNGDYNLDLNLFDFYNFDNEYYFNKKFEEIFGKPRLKDEKITKRHFDIAASLQKTVEEYVFSAIKYLKKETKLDNLCLTGGVFMNSVLNGKIYNSNIFKNVFIPFAPDDSGNSIGASIWIEKNKKQFAHLSPYLGRKFTDKQIEKTLVLNKIKFHKIKNISKDAANELTKNKIICWFQGQSEFGQRALGNRSILADPRNINMKDKINKYVKFREEFRPFAGSVIESKANSLFISGKTIISPYMEKVFICKTKFTNKIPAIVHVDNSTRIQTVNRNQNKLYFDLINNFYKITDVPIILNTSFNINNEPIVDSPDDAIRTFFSCGADILYIGNFKIIK